MAEGTFGNVGRISEALAEGRDIVCRSWGGILLES
jgi:hypothetical protein